MYDICAHRPLLSPVYFCAEEGAEEEEEDLGKAGRAPVELRAAARVFLVRWEPGWGLPPLPPPPPTLDTGALS